MNPKISGVFICTIVVATFITGAVAYPLVHSVRLAFGLPITLVILWGLWALLPAIDPIAKGFPGFRYVYDFFWILLSAVLAYAYALSLGAALGWPVNIFHAVLPAVAMLVFVAAILLPQIHRNWFFGIRTPWTLSSDDVWMKTHQFGRPLFIIVAVLIYISTFVSRTWSIGIVSGSILLATIGIVAYSYFIFRRH